MEAAVAVAVAVAAAAAAIVVAGVVVVAVAQVLAIVAQNQVILHVIVLNLIHVVDKVVAINMVKMMMMEIRSRIINNNLHFIIH